MTPPGFGCAQRLGPQPLIVVSRGRELESRHTPGDRLRRALWGDRLVIFPSLSARDFSLRFGFVHFENRFVNRFVGVVLCPLKTSMGAGRGTAASFPGPTFSPSSNGSDCLPERPTRSRNLRASPRPGWRRTLILRCAYLAMACLLVRYVSEQAARRPGPGVPRLLWEANPMLGRAAYRWIGEPDPDQPRWQPKARRDYTRAEIDLAELVAAIPNDCDWHGWDRIGMAIFAASGGSDQGGIVFDDFSARSPQYNPYTTAQRWHHYRRSPPSRIGIGTLVHLAKRARWRRSAAS
jgi:hypothetical protein